MFRSIVALFTALCVLASTACTSMRPVDAQRPEAARAAVKVGDEVSVTASNGKTYLLKLIAVDEEKIIGVGDNKKVTIRYAQMERLEVKRLSAAKSTGLGALLLVAAGVILVLVGFNEAFDDLGE